MVATDRPQNSVLMLKSDTALKPDNMRCCVADYFKSVSLQRRRQITYLLRSEASYYRNCREQSNTKTTILNQLKEESADVDVWLQTVR